MKVEKREIAKPKPPCEIVVTMTGQEAESVRYAIYYYCIRRSPEFQENCVKKEGYDAIALKKLHDLIGAAR